ncbi:DUF3823 domain-containing protein [Fibrivirga algicola]|uniref:DUF3823 domain-containing protein n=1 Tax=Fibrivirga algicola TaxID=2950420 RepID=A0ABX0Q9E1_9BACT|nr:DUF3823 domain-containing protein [Fibrivirga algicola]ARK09145.1 hypothetical protein A6C57_01765 [Fibrella sp. ES10-3-2-2]NID08740.1 DUF3823 domain-containing protein [Fibrivirga algicola]
MKAILFSLLAGTILMTSCQKDNFEPPKSTLTGRVIYENQPVGVRTNGVQLELWQRGYQLFTKIPLLVGQDGTFSAVLFDGDYKLVRLRGNGPWVDNTDTIAVQVRGSATIDVPVQPYFVIRNPTVQRSGTNLTGSCTVAQATAGRAIERVTMYVGTTQFVDATNNVGSVNLTGTALADLSKPLALSLALPTAVSSRAYFYARIGVKTVGVAELLYAPVQKITQ